MKLSRDGMEVHPVGMSRVFWNLSPFHEGTTQFMENASQPAQCFPMNFYSSIHNFYSYNSDEFQVEKQKPYLQGCSATMIMTLNESTTQYFKDYMLFVAQQFF